MGLCSNDILSKVVNDLNGTKVLILGNHDKKMNAMYNAGFDVVIYSISLEIAGHRVTMSHCPLFGVWREDTAGMKNSVNENWHGESRDKHRKYTLTDEDQFHLHGHIHSPNGGKSKRILGKQFDVGVRANGYKPVNISQIESWIAKYGC